MNSPEAAFVASNRPPISSAHHYLSRASSSKAEQGASQESDLLRSIRATLRGSRGISDSSVHSILYASYDPAFGEQQLCWDAATVTLSSGGIMRRSWSFHEEGQPIQWACIGIVEQSSTVASSSSLRPAHYTYDYHEQSTPIADSSKRPTFGPFTRAQQQQKRDQESLYRVRAVFVFLRSICKMFLLNGVEYTFHLPFIVRKAWPLYPHGLLIQRVYEVDEAEEAKQTGDAPLPTMFTFVNPFAEPAAVGMTEKLVEGFTSPAFPKDDDPDKPMNYVPADEHVVWVSQREPNLTEDVIVTVNSDKRLFSIWRYAHVQPTDLPTNPRPMPTRSMAQKRSSMTAPPPILRRTAAADGHVRVSSVSEPVPLGALPGMAPTLDTITTMASIMDNAAAPKPHWVTPDPERVRSRHDRHDSIGRPDLSFTLDRMALGARQAVELPADPAETERMKPAFWMEQLHTQEIGAADLAAADSISVGLFDERWDGKTNRTLMGICLPATKRLFVFSLNKQDDETMALRPETWLDAISVASIQGIRSIVWDLLLLKPEGTLVLLTHGLYELPLQISQRDTEKDVTVMDVDEPYHARPPSNQVIVGIRDVIESSVTVVYLDGTEARVHIDLMPRDTLTFRCLYMLAMTLPVDTFFALHSCYLRRWSQQNLSTHDGIEFDSFTSALCDTFDLDHPTNPIVPSSIDTIDLWRALSTTTSASRFREDPIMRKLALPPTPAVPLPPQPVRKSHPYLPAILHALHHLGEELRLVVRHYHALLRLVPVICKIAFIVRPEWADFWKRLCPDAIDIWPSQVFSDMTYYTSELPLWPPDLSAILYGRINNPDWNFPMPETYNMARLFKLEPSYAFGRADPLLRHRQLTSIYMSLADNKVPETRKRAENALNSLVRCQLGLDDLRILPLGIAAPLREACRTCQLSPGGDWSLSAYQIIGRNDLAEGLNSTPDLLYSYGYRSKKDYILPLRPRRTIHEHIEDTCKMIMGDFGAVSGVELDLEDFMQIRFGQDRRLEEVARMLCSSTVPTIRAIDRPELSEHDQAKEHQHQVIRLAERTLALPLGRALFTFGAVPTVTREAYAIPKIEYAVRLQPNSILMVPEPGKIPIECLAWGEFHNGVAAGLRISSQSNAVESSWIKFNKPSELTPEHAGFLFALGLTGHLREMLTWHTFGYLTPKHDMTSIGVLLGLSAANMGSSNKHVTKLLAVHTPALLPTPTVDLNVPLITQAAGLMGIGLLYMGTKNRRMAEVCLNQISRKDLYQPDLSNEYREAYTLSAALACGMVMLGKGTSVPADLALLARLRILVHGEGHTSLQGKEARPSFDINLTSPAATIALGLMYLKTERQDVADILSIPDTDLALKRVQPGFLMLRCLSRALIMWNKIAPTKEWLGRQIPMNIAAVMDARFRGKPTDDAFELAYYNILAGCCFAVALKYAGTAGEEAYLLLIHYYDMFSQLAYTNSAAYDHRIKRAAIRDGLNLISLSLSMVMAGTGEINCLRRLRYAYGMYNQPIRYGTHVATHMSLGLLFLGGGRFTLGTSDAAIACMVTAFFPRFAQVSSDNKSYLQAYRHLWVLAVEPRCLIARDVDTREIVYLPVKIKVREGKMVGITQMISPTLIPDLDKLLSIRVDTPRYWPFYLDVANYPRHRESLLRSQTLFVKRRTAFLSYMEDPKGSRSLFVRSGSATGDAATLDFPRLTDIKTHPASDLHHFISSFSNDALFLAFADRLCREDGNTPEERLLQSYCHATLLDSILQDKTQTIQSHLTLYRLRTMSPTSQYFVLRAQDLRFATDFYNKIYDRRFSGRTENNARPALIRENTLSGALHALDLQLDTIRESAAFRKILHRYALGQAVLDVFSDLDEVAAARDLAWYLQRNSVPAYTVLFVLRMLSQQTQQHCTGPSPPERTTDVGCLGTGIKEVLHATGSQMTTAMGSGWSVRSMDEVTAAWSGQLSAADA